MTFQNHSIFLETKVSSSTRSAGTARKLGTSMLDALALLSAIVRGSI